MRRWFGVAMRVVALAKRVKGPTCAQCMRHVQALFVADHGSIVGRKKFIADETALIIAPPEKG